MTISTEVSKVIAGGNGSATVFSFAPMPIFEASNLEVRKVVADGTETVLTLGSGSTNYSVTVASYPGTGSVTYPATGSTRLASGESLVMRRIIPLTQETDLENHGGYFPEVLEGALDTRVAQMQQMQEELDRTLRFSPADVGTGIFLPSADERAGMVLAFDGDGNPVAGAVSTAIVSSPMEDVVAAASRSDARALMTLAPMVSIDQYGAFGAGGDNTAQIQAALDASLVVYFPPTDGAYRVLSTLTLRPGHYLFGAGWASLIKAEFVGPIFELADNASSGGLQSNVVIKDMRLFGQSAANGIHFKKQINTRVEGVIFEGLVHNVDIDQGRNHFVVNCTSYPNQYRVAGNLQFTSTDNANFVFYPIVDNYQVYTSVFDTASIVEGARSPCIFMRRAIRASVKNFNADRLDISPSGVAGIHFENDCQGCKVLDGSTHGAYIGVLLTQGSGPTVAPSYLEITSHDIDAFTGAGIAVAGNTAACVNITVTGGQITNPDTGVPCISINHAINVIVNGVSILQYDGTTSGIGVQFGNSDGVRITNCSMYKMATGVAFIGTANVGAQVVNNSLTLCTAALSGDVTAGGAGSNRVATNRGINPRAVTTPAVPASTTYISNKTGGDVLVTVAGGTNVSIGVNGVSIGVLLSPGGVATYHTVFVPSDGTVGVGYVVAPTWVWTGL